MKVIICAGKTLTTPAGVLGPGDTVELTDKEAASLIAEGIVRLAPPLVMPPSLADLEARVAALEQLLDPKGNV